MKMKIITAVAALALASYAHAAVSIDVGTHTLLAGLGGQKIQLFVTGDEPVTGFNLRAQIGDGTGPNDEPLFSAIDFSSSIWDVHTTSLTGGPVDGAAQFAQAGVLFDTANDLTQANGHLVDLIIDTTGIAPGIYDLKLSDTEIGVDSSFIVSGGDELIPTITNGTINVVLPEPALLGLTIPALLVVRRRRA